MSANWIIVWLAFVFGFWLGAWCNNDKAAERGYRAGKAMRQWLGLPPINNHDG